MNRTGVLAATVLSLHLHLDRCRQAAEYVSFSRSVGQQNIGIRTVSGAGAIDGGSQPVPRATVFLQNDKTKTIRSFVSTPDGHFHFAQVDMSTDFAFVGRRRMAKKSVTKTA